MKKAQYFNRELSWLSFNYRVLQEAKDPRVPLYERIKFLAIYSSNLDEFFRVRVASLRSLQELKEKTKEKLGFRPSELLRKIHTEVSRQQEEYGRIYNEAIIPLLEENNIFILDDKNITPVQQKYVSEYFDETVVPHVRPVLLIKDKINPFLQNLHLYLAVRLRSKTSGAKKRIRYNYAIVDIPARVLPRFVELPKEGTKNYILFLDDIIRLNLHKVFPGFDVVDTFSIKLTRDAELYIDDEFSGNLLQKIQKGLKRRDTGAPSRFLYDSGMPKEFLRFISSALSLESGDLVAGGKYHNFNDFFAFPNPVGSRLEYKPLPPLKRKELEQDEDIFRVISGKDRALFFPYHRYDYVTGLIKKAAGDPDVISIKITQYRVARNSEIVKSMIRAAKNGKDAMAFVELKARFDEESNIQWANEMEAAGVKVYYSFPGLKVHCKILAITRKEGDSIKEYCYLATGNFNEKTARLYGDFGLFTTDERITGEVESVFRALAGGKPAEDFKHLLVAQYNMRDEFGRLVRNEIKAAKKGQKAGLTLKMNSLEDRKMVNLLYEASSAGVKINLIIRGICCLVPGVKEVSENIKVISIVDRFLEHARFYIFENHGNPLVYAASADWMKRNLSRRIEVCFPVYDPDIKREILDTLDIQLNDNTKARIIDKKDRNSYRGEYEAENSVRAQVDTYNYFLNKELKDQ